MKLYKFYKPNCPPCYSMSRYLLQMEIPNSIELIEMNVDKEENKLFAKIHGIDKVPALMREDGTFISGLKQKEEIQSFVNGINYEISN